MLPREESPEAVSLDTLERLRAHPGERVTFVHGGQELTGMVRVTTADVSIICDGDTAVPLIVRDDDESRTLAVRLFSVG